MTTASGSPDVYGLDPIGNPVYVEREGRKFKAAGIGTSDMIYSFYHEIDDSGNVISESALPMQWWFPDPAKVESERQRAEKERQRIERAASFPVEGMSGIFGSGLAVWPTDGDEHESLGFSVAECRYCGKNAPSLYVSDDYMDTRICRECLSKIFDVFEQHEKGEGE